jgi:uncharacterized damage-inducible protein DinB
MNEARLKIPDGYNPETQRTVGIFAAQLDDLLARLKRAVAGLTVEQLEWQLHAGMNTIGMLLAHNAVVETFWLMVAPKGLPVEPDGNERIKEIIGIRGNEDGLPLPPEGTHPESLSGKTLDEYLAMLDTARTVVHGELRTWTDDGLDTFFNVEDYRISRAWVLYHVLEHLAAHVGQVLILMHIMRDRGVLSSK